LESIETTATRAITRSRLTHLGDRSARAIDRSPEIERSMRACSLFLFVLIMASRFT